MIHHQLKRIFYKESRLYEYFLDVLLETDKTFFLMEDGIIEKKEVSDDGFYVYEPFEEWYSHKQFPLIEAVKIDYEGSILIKLSDGNFLGIYLDSSNPVGWNSVQTVHLFTKDIIDESFLANYHESGDLTLK